MTFQAVFERIWRLMQASLTETDQPEERDLLRSTILIWIADEGDFMLQMLRSFDNDLSWSTVTANRDMETVRELLMHPNCCCPVLMIVART